MAALGRPSEISNLKFQIAKRTAEGGHPTYWPRSKPMSSSVSELTATLMAYTSHFRRLCVTLIDLQLCCGMAPSGHGIHRIQQRILIRFRMLVTQTPVEQKSF